MSSAVFWYVQARLQARHGERMDEAHWRALEGAQSFLTYLDRTRSTPVCRFTELVPADASAHVVERRLREARRGYAEEIASWMPASWRRAVRWAALLPDLPILAYLCNGGAAWPWMMEDPLVGPLAQAPAAVRDEALKQAGLGAFAAGFGETAIATAWLDRWRSLWPTASRNERRELDTLVAGVTYYFERSASAASGTQGANARGDLVRHFNRCFRASIARPAAVFSHLGLVTLDIERLKGGLLRRLLLETEKSASAA